MTQEHEQSQETARHAVPTTAVVRPSIKLSNSNFARVKFGKGTSIRLGDKNYSVGIHDLESVSGDKMRVDVIEVRKIRFGSLGLLDAVTDGFNSIPELRRELEECYKTFISPSDVVTQLRFVPY